MTRRGLSLVVAAVGCWAVGRLLGIDEFLVLSVAAAATVVLTAAAVFLAGSSVAVRRRVARVRLPAGATTRVRMQLRNESWLPLPLLLAEDAVDPVLLPPRSAARFVVSGLRRGAGMPLVYTVRGNLRGHYTLGPLTLRLRDPFGLVERTRRYRSTEQLVVYPAVEQLPGGMHLGRHHGTGASRSRRLFNAGDEFHTMREFVEGDDLRQVHWPSTAHRQRLMVRQNELSWDTQATVLCDTRSQHHHGSGATSSLERAVSAAASVVCHLDTNGYRVRLVTEEDVRPVPATSRDELLDRLAVIESTEGRTLGPLLQQMRSGDAQGLLVAILPAAPGAASGRAGPSGDAAGGASGELTALLQMSRGYTGRIAVVLDTGAPGSAARAAQTAALLSAAAWRAVVWVPGTPFATAWRDAMAARTAGRRSPGAPAGATPSPDATPDVTTAPIGGHPA